jgi:DNA-binding transcriptional LysR family regulator
LRSMAGTPDLNLLPLFVAVAESGSMSAAARKLGGPKSSVSRGIAALERTLDVQLFHRTTRNVTLTGAGTAFYEKARPLLAALRELSEDLPEQEKEPAGELRVTMPTDMGLTFLVEAAAQFAARYPGVRLDVRPTNRFVDLLEEGFDVALRLAPRLQSSTFVARKLSEIEMGLYGAPSYVARRGAPRNTDEASTHDWVIVRGLQFPKTLERPKLPRLVTDELMFAHGVVREGVAIGILPSFLAHQDVASGRLVRLLPRWSQPAGTLYFVYPPTKHLPRKVAAFRDFLSEFLAARPLS